MFDLPPLRDVMGILRVLRGTIVSAPGATSEYSWGDESLRFVRCKTCGCVTHWEPMHPKDSGRMGVNARNFEHDAIRSIRIRLLDGASSWKYLD